jgi:RNA polymerase sigma-70 factor (ECF subfamily)
MRERDVARLYEDHAQDLFAFLAYRTGDRALAEDLLADTFERVLTARRGHDARRGSVKTWLYAIALNLLRDHLRRAGAERRALERTRVPVVAGSDAGADDARFAQVDDRDQIGGALQALPEDEREALALRYGADLGMREIARVLDEPLTTVEGRVRRGLRRLRDEVEPT